TRRPPPGILVQPGSDRSAFPARRSACRVWAGPKADSTFPAPVCTFEYPKRVRGGSERSTKYKERRTGLGRGSRLEWPPPLVSRFWDCVSWLRSPARLFGERTLGFWLRTRTPITSEIQTRKRFTPNPAPQGDPCTALEPSRVRPLCSILCFFARP